MMMMMMIAVRSVTVSQNAFVPPPGLQTAVSAAQAVAPAVTEKSDSLGLAYLIRAYQVNNCISLIAMPIYVLISCSRLCVYTPGPWS